MNSQVTEYLAPYAGVALRAFVVYLLITLILKLFAQKEIGDFSAQDLVLMLLTAELVAPSILGEETTIISAAVAFGTVFLTDKLINYTLYQLPGLRKVIESEPIIIIQHGKVNPKNMKKLKITEEELNQLLREKGHLSPKGVKFGLIESDGMFSLIETATL